MSFAIHPVICPLALRPAYLLVPLQSLVGCPANLAYPLSELASDWSITVEYGQFFEIPPHFLPVDVSAEAAMIAVIVMLFAMGAVHGTFSQWTTDHAYALPPGFRTTAFHRPTRRSLSNAPVSRGP